MWVTCQMLLQKNIRHLKLILLVKPASSSSSSALEWAHPKIFNYIQMLEYIPDAPKLHDELCCFDHVMVFCLGKKGIFGQTSPSHRCWSRVQWCWLGDFSAPTDFKFDKDTCGLASFFFWSNIWEIRLAKDFYSLTIILWNRLSSTLKAALTCIMGWPLPYLYG